MLAAQQAPGQAQHDQQHHQTASTTTTTSSSGSSSNTNNTHHHLPPPPQQQQQQQPLTTHHHIPASAALLQSSLPPYGLLHQSIIPHSLMIPTVYAFNQQLLAQQHLLHSAPSFPEIIHHQQQPLLPFQTNRNFQNTPILGPPQPPLLTRSAHSHHFTPGSTTTTSASPSLHHHQQTHSRSLSTNTNNNNNKSTTTTANNNNNNQMYRHNDIPSQSRYNNPLSGSSGIPLPRSRTQSTQSDRSSPLSHHAPPQKPFNNNSNNSSNNNNGNLFRLRTDSQNSITSSSHGYSHGPSAHLVKPIGSLNEPQFSFHSPTTGHPTSTPTHSFNTSNHNNNMVRRSSPLAQSTQSSPANHPPAPSEKDQTHRHPSTPSITSASYRNSSASTVTITSASTPTVPGSITLVPVLHADDEADEDSDTTSDVDHRPPGHRSTPGTSVDSSTSNFTQPDDSPAASKTSTAPLPERHHHKHSKHSLSNKLRRALSINALQENIMHDSIPELDPVVSHERLKSSSASIAGVPSSPSIANTGKSGRQPRRFGFLNSKSNSSTDNLSISSTVSSASVMIRKLGNLGKSARSKGVMSLTKIFKDKNDLAVAAESDTDDNKGYSTKASKRALGMNQQKNLASISVAQVQAEVDRSLSVEFPGMTPAAAFIHKQKQQYAQQEAAAAAAAAAAADAAAAAATSASEALSQTHSSESARSKGRASSIGSSGSLTPGSASEARKKMIEKEKEKIKSKKSRKWGFGIGSSTSASDDLPASTCVEDLRRPSERSPNAEEAEDWDDNTVRNANVEGLIDPYTGVPRRSVEELRNGDDDDDDDNDNEGIDEYDMESLYSSIDGTSSSARRPGLKPRPSREAVPKKGILKNAQNFSQEQHLSPTLSHPAKPLSGSTTSDRPQPGTTREDPMSLPQIGKQSERPDSVIDFGSQMPNLTLSIAGAEVKDRRATFAQHLSVHTTWPPAIYDRRGELATCNRLTPTLAQRIKEEINAFKMEEMDVHYASRVNTHFFV